MTAAELIAELSKWDPNAKVVIRTPVPNRNFRTYKHEIIHVSQCSDVWDEETKKWSYCCGIHTTDVKGS